MRSGSYQGEWQAADLPLADMSSTPRQLEPPLWSTGLLRSSIRGSEENEVDAEARSITLLAGLSASELNKVDAFLKEVPIHIAGAFLAIMSSLDCVAHRSKFLALLEDLPDVSGTIMACRNLDQGSLIELMLLHNALPTDRFLDLVNQDNRRLRAFLELLPKIDEDLRELILRDSEPLTFASTLQIMEDVLSSDEMEKCGLCRMKRRLQFDMDMSQTRRLMKGRLPKQPKPSDVWVEPASQSLLSLAASGDDGTPDVYFDKCKVDLHKLCLGCLREVQRFVSEHRNAHEMHHTLGQVKKDLMTDNWKLARDKARWWTEKGHKMGYVVQVLELFMRCRRHLHEHEVEVQRLQTLAEREKRANYRRELASTVRFELVNRASELDHKWLAQERRSTDKLFAAKRLYSILQEEKELGYSRKATKNRENPKSIKLAGFLEPEMVPITAERASEVFGTRKPVVKDYTEDLRAWKQAACDYDKYAKVYLSVKESMLQRARRKAWSVEMERWRAGMNYMDERHTKKVLWEKQENLNRQLARSLKREAAKAAREELLREWHRNEGHRLSYETWKAEENRRERDAEARERHDMAAEEAEQCRVDHFWGYDRRAKEAQDWLYAYKAQRREEAVKKREVMRTMGLSK